MPNRPSEPTPPSTDDFAQLNRNMSEMNRDRDRGVLNTEIQTNKLSAAISHLTRTISHGTAAIASSTNKYGQEIGRKVSSELLPDKSTHSGRAGMAVGGLVGAVVAQAVADSGIGDAVKAKVKESLKEAGSKTAQSIRAQSVKFKKNPKAEEFKSRAIRNQTAKDINEQSSRFKKKHAEATARFRKRIEEDKPKKAIGAIYAKNVYGKAQNLKKSGDVITAVDRLRLSNQQIAAKTLTPTSKEIAKIKHEAPKARTGGYVARGGLAEIHQAEIIVPRKDVDKQVMLLSAIHETMKNQNTKIDALSKSSEDSNADKGGIWPIIKMFTIDLKFGHIISGRYAKDIPRDKNPFITMVNGILKIHEWQRLYGELQKDQMNALLQIQSKNPALEFGVRGRRGWLFEWFNESKKKLTDKVDNMKEGKNKQRAKFFNGLLQFIGYDDELWRKERDATGRRAMDAAVFSDVKNTKTEKESKGFWNAVGKNSDFVKNFERANYDLGEKFVTIDTRIDDFSDRIKLMTDALPANVEVKRQKFIDDIANIDRQLNATDDFTKERLAKKSKLSALHFKSETIYDKLVNKRAEAISELENLKKDQFYGDDLKALDKKLKKDKKKNEVHVNDWHGGPGEILSMLTKAGKKIIPHKDDMVTAVKTKTDPVVTKLSEIAENTKSTSDKTSQQIKITKDMNKTAQEEAKRNRKAAFWDKMKKNPAGKLLMGALDIVSKISSVIFGLLPLLILIAMNPKKALATLKWAFESKEHAAKGAVSLYKFFDMFNVNSWRTKIAAGKEVKGAITAAKTAKSATAASKAVAKKGVIKGMVKKAAASATTKISAEVLEQAAKGAAKGAAKKTASKLGSKGILKALQKIPYLGIILGPLLGIVFSAFRFKKGDVVGGLMELGSGLAMLLDLTGVPVLGSALSLAIDAAIIARDIKMGSVKEGKLKDNTKSPLINAITGVVNGVVNMFKNIGEKMKNLFEWSMTTGLPKMLDGIKKLAVEHMKLMYVKLPKFMMETAGKLIKTSMTMMAKFYVKLPVMLLKLIGKSIEVSMKMMAAVFIKLPMYLTKIAAQITLKLHASLIKIAKKLMHPKELIKSIMASDFIKNLADGVDKTIDYLLQFPGKLLNSIKTSIKTGWEYVKTAYIDGIKSFIESLIGGVKGVLDTIMGAWWTRWKENRDKQTQGNFAGVGLTDEQMANFQKAQGGKFNTVDGGIKGIENNINNRSLGVAAAKSEIEKFSQILGRYGNNQKTSSKISNLIENGLDADTVLKKIKAYDEKKQSKRDIAESARKAAVAAKLNRKYGSDTVMSYMASVKNIDDVAKMLEHTDGIFGWKKTLSDKMLSVMNACKTAKETDYIGGLLVKGMSPEDARSALNKMRGSTGEKLTGTAAIVEDRGKILAEQARNQKEIDALLLKEKRNSGIISEKDFGRLNTLLGQQSMLKFRLDAANKVVDKVDKKSNLSDAVADVTGNKFSTATDRSNAKTYGPYKQEMNTSTSAVRFNKDLLTRDNKLPAKLNNLSNFNPALIEPVHVEPKAIDKTGDMVEQSKTNEVGRRVNEAAPIIEANKNLSKTLEKNAKDSSANMANSMATIINNNNSTNSTNNSSGGGSGGNVTFGNHWKNIDDILGGNII